MGSDVSHVTVSFVVQGRQSQETSAHKPQFLKRKVGRSRASRTCDLTLHTTQAPYPLGVPTRPSRLTSQHQLLSCFWGLCCQWGTKADQRAISQVTVTQYRMSRRLDVGRSVADKGTIPETPGRQEHVNESPPPPPPPSPRPPAKLKSHLEIIFVSVGVSGRLG